MRKKCCYGQKNLGSICSSLSPSPSHLSHTRNIILSRIKCERYIFIKKCVRSFIEVVHYLLIVSAYICICICMRLYNSSIDTDVNVVFAGDEGRPVVADFPVKSFKFRLVVVYAPNTAVERVSFFRRLVPFLDDSKRLVLMGDWNAILDPKIDKVGWRASRLGRCESSLIDLMARHDLVDRFRLDHSGREMWTWLDSSTSAKVGSYLDRVLEELTVISFVVPRSTS